MNGKNHLSNNFNFQTYREHLEGQKHKKKEAQVKSGTTQPLAKSKASFRCDLCGVTCTGSDTYQAHVRGAKHQKVLESYLNLSSRYWPLTVIF